jgi:hypothetical protein
MAPFLNVSEGVSLVWAITGIEKNGISIKLSRIEIVLFNFFIASGLT